MRKQNHIAALSLVILSVMICRRPCAAAEPPAPADIQQSLVVSGQGYFPVAQRLQDGRIAIVLRGGAMHVGIKGRLDTVFSSDEGKTWTKPTVVVDTPLDDRNPAFGQAKDGTLVVAYWRSAKDTYDDYSKDDPAKPVSTWVTRSTDGGKSWQEPTEIDVRDIGYGSPYGKILTLADGAMLMNAYGFTERPADAKGPGDKTDCSYLYRSTDNGKTWKRASLIGKHFNETGLLEMEGTLFAAMRGADANNGVSLTRSTDGGKTWSAPVEVAPKNHHPADLIRLADGTIHMAIGCRSGSFGVIGLVGTVDKGFDWKQHVQIVSDSPSTDTGYPSSVLLKDGRVLTAYYAVGSKTHPDWGTHCGAVIYTPAAVGDVKAR